MWCGSEPVHAVEDAFVTVVAVALPELLVNVKHVARLHHVILPGPGADTWREGERDRGLNETEQGKTPCPKPSMKIAWDTLLKKDTFFEARKKGRPSEPARLLMDSQKMKSLG